MAVVALKNLALLLSDPLWGMNPAKQNPICATPRLLEQSSVMTTYGKFSIA